MSNGQPILVVTATTVENAQAGVLKLAELIAQQRARTAKLYDASGQRVPRPLQELKWAAVAVLALAGQLGMFTDERSLRDFCSQLGLVD